MSSGKNDDPRASTWKRILRAATIASAILWVAITGIWLYRYLAPQPDTIPYVPMTANVAVKASVHSLWLRVSRDEELLARLKSDRWGATLLIDTLGARMQSFRPTRPKAERWAIMIVTLPYGMLTTVTAFLPFVWLIGVARRQQKLRECAAVPT